MYKLFDKIIDIWKETRREKGTQDEDNKFDYDFVTYERI